MCQFNEILRNIHSEQVYIQTHNFPDPDAIASAFGLAELLGHYGKKASIVYKGKVERYSTADFVRQLSIEMVNLDENPIEPGAEIILVDSQKGNSNIFDAPGEQIICIDHHPTFAQNAGVKYRCSDIRPEMGACATIIADYYRQTGAAMDRRVATALLYGIKTDTVGLSRGVSQLDVDTYCKLYQICDQGIIQSLEHCSLKLEDLKAYSTAINSIKTYENVSVANAGRDCPEALIAKVSDFMIDLVEVDFCVVYSLREDGIKLSVRSMGELDAGFITNKALDGIGGGGGHAVMAGGFVPFSEEETGARPTISKECVRFFDEDTDDRLEALAQSIRERFTEAIRYYAREERELKKA